MYYRRKIILALLEPAFDFMPYHYGCYSAQVAQDLGTMHKLNLIESRAHDDLLALKNALKKYKRIALTCFEADAEACHRKRTAAALNAMIPGTVPTVHL